MTIQCDPRKHAPDAYDLDDITRIVYTTITINYPKTTPFKMEMGAPYTITFWNRYGNVMGSTDFWQTASVYKYQTDYYHMFGELPL